MQKLHVRETGQRAVGEQLRSGNRNTFIYLINMQYLLT